MLQKMKDAPGHVNPELVLPVAEAAHLLAVTVAALYGMIERGAVASVPSAIGRRKIGVTVATVEALVGPVAPDDLARAKAWAADYVAGERVRLRGRYQARKVKAAQAKLERSRARFKNGKPDHRTTEHMAMMRAHKRNKNLTGWQRFWAWLTEA